MKVTKIRTQRAQVGVVVFSIAALVFLLQIGNKSLTVRAIRSVFGAACLLGIIRSSRSGLLELGEQTLKVRTLYRTRRFDRAEVIGIEVRNVAQVTPRVMPVLILRGGKEYPLSEFFVQSKSFRLNPEDNIVRRVVSEVHAWLCSD